MRAAVAWLVGWLAALPGSPAAAQTAAESADPRAGFLALAQAVGQWRVRAGELGVALPPPAEFAFGWEAELRRGALPEAAQAGFAGDLAAHARLVGGLLRARPARLTALRRTPAATVEVVGEAAPGALARLLAPAEGWALASASVEAGSPPPASPADGAEWAAPARKFLLTYVRDAGASTAPPPQGILASPFGPERLVWAPSAGWQRPPPRPPEPPAAAPAPEVRLLALKAEPLPFALVGVVEGPGGPPLALLRLPDGAHRRLRAGQRWVDAAEILAVRPAPRPGVPAEADLRLPDGRVWTLRAGQAAPAAAWRARVGLGGQTATLRVGESAELGGLALTLLAVDPSSGTATLNVAGKTLLLSLAPTPAP